MEGFMGWPLIPELLEPDIVIEIAVGQRKS